MSGVVGLGQIVDAAEAASEWIVLDGAQSSVHLLPHVMGVLDGGELRLMHPETTLAIYEEAIVTPRSDLVILPRTDCDLVVWEKFFLPNMCKTLPQDRNLLDYDRALQDRSIKFSLPANLIRVEAAISLLGANAWHWVHFITEYLTRLVLTLPVLPNSRVSVLVAEDLDANCLDLLQAVLVAFPAVDILRISPDEAVHCGRLYLASKGTYLCDHSETIASSDIVVRHWAPEVILGAIRQFDEQERRGTGAVPLVQPPRKIFFPRKPGYRSLANAEQITELMLQAGYELLDPADLSLAEKLQVFGRATHVAQIAGSAGFNVLFCPPGARVLSISPFNRSFDLLGPTLRKDIEFHVLPGVDLSSRVHTDFSVTPEQVATALAIFDPDSTGHERRPGPSTVFVYQADWAGFDWVEILLGFCQAFVPGEPVALALPLGDQVAQQEAEGMLLEVLEQTGRTAFPDVILLGPGDDETEVFRPYQSVQPVPQDPNRRTYPNLHALRFAKALTRLQRSPD